MFVMFKLVTLSNTVLHSTAQNRTFLLLKKYKICKNVETILNNKFFFLMEVEKTK